MKKLLNWFVLAMLMVVTMPLASCDDDDNTLKTTEVTAENIVGTWDQGEKYQTTEKATVDFTNSLLNLTQIQFLADGNLVATKGNEKVNGTFTLNGEKITINAGDVVVNGKVAFRSLDTNVLCISYDTKGILPSASEDVDGKEIDVTVTVHYTRAK